MRRRVQDRFQHLSPKAPPLAGCPHPLLALYSTSQHLALFCPVHTPHPHPEHTLPPQLSMSLPQNPQSNLLAEFSRGSQQSSISAPASRSSTTTSPASPPLVCPPYSSSQPSAAISSIPLLSSPTPTHGTTSRPTVATDGPALTDRPDGSG